MTALTMMFFAANSVLARFALRERQIDAGSFTVVRILSGALALAIILACRPRGMRAIGENGSLPAAAALFGYAIAFSFAYVSLGAATGALILFAVVQVTMLAAGMLRGERPMALEWIGLSMAFGGLVYLVLPGLTAPSPIGAALMAIAGVGWGCYSLAAGAVRFPTAATAGNFARATPMAAGTLFVICGTGNAHASWMGLGLAVISGAMASGIGYAIWYVALKNLRTTQAAIVQLTVPLITTAGGVILLGEPVTLRLVLASSAILGGVALALLTKTATVLSGRPCPQ
jgi:drug/metabolite transporter (DMT)-like permease